MSDINISTAPASVADEKILALANYLQEKLSEQIVTIEFHKDELCLIAKPSSIVDVMKFLRDDDQCQFKQLVDVCGADYPDRPQRFEVIYNLLSLTKNSRIRVKVLTDENTPVNSVTGVFSSAGWNERETWDMYGIYFAGHADLRRILTDYGFEGHPLRKDFPLTGYVELRYDEEQRRVVYEPVKLQQDFRGFDYLSPWEGMTDVQLPGDEKANIPLGWKPVNKSPTAQEK